LACAYQLFDGSASSTPLLTQPAMNCIRTAGTDPSRDEIFGTHKHVARPPGCSTGSRTLVDFFQPPHQMNQIQRPTATPLSRLQMAGRVVLRHLLGSLFLAVSTIAHAQESGTISGRVINPDKGEYIRNAEIQVEGMALVVNSGADGSYRLHNIPAGRVVLKVTYSGFPPATATLTLPSGGNVTHNFELRSIENFASSDSTTKMDPFTVSTSREGQAKAIMAQKASLTDTNVIAADSFASLAEGNVAELLQYLPGVEVNPDGALSSTISIRGMGPDYGGLTVDGMAGLTTTHGTGRAPVYIRTNLSAVDLVELNKTVSADMDASAPAGTVNLKSKTAFQLTGRSIAWQMYLTGTSADMDFDESYGAGFGRRRKLIPGGSLEYSDIFLDGKLGVVASAASTISHLPHNNIVVTYDTTPTATRPEPIVPTNVAFTDTPVLRKVSNYGLSLDYKLGKNTVLSLRGQGQVAKHSFFTRSITLIATRATLDAASNGTRMNAIAGPATVNTPRITMSSGAVERDQTTWMIKPSIVYTGEKLELDVAVAFSDYDHTRIQHQPPTDGLGFGPLTTVNTTFYPVGWTATRNNPGATDWNFVQTSGADFRSPEAWNASAATNNVNRAVEDTGRTRYIGQANAKYQTDWSQPTFFKAGIKSDEQIFRLDSRSYAYTYVGPTGDRLQASIPVSENTVDLQPARYGSLFSQPAYVRNLSAMTGLLHDHPEYFAPSAANATSATNLFPDRYVRERIDSAYIMGNTQWKKWVFQGGVRYEETQHRYKVYERGIPERRTGKYDGTFLSGAAKYRFRPDLMATFSASESIRRPNYGNLTGVATINDDLMTGNIPNPNLKPEWGNNYSARVEYYFEPAGNLSAGVFQSDMADLIYQRTLVPAEEIGLGGQYPGYLFTSWDNREASFRIRGFELAYRQQLTFLPGALRGLGIFANYTKTKNSDPEFQYNIAPATASAGFTFRYRRLNVSLNGAWTREKLISATTYQKSRIMAGLSAGYKLRSNVSLFVTARDLSKSSSRRYDRRFPDHIGTFAQYATQWTVGVSGSY
jgi:iron complex outermembrane recepter protein